MIFEYLKEHMCNYTDSIIRDEERAMTYLELLERAEELGKTLTYHKYGVLCSSELDAAIGVLACFYAGCTAVLLSARYGDKHNQNIMEHIKLPYLITESGIKTIGREVEETEDLSDVGLILCTSGTTGRPKGAMITYENLRTNLEDINQYFAIRNTDRILIARPLYHGAVLTGEFLISLINGLDIVFINSGFAPVTILQAVRKYEITVFGATPTIFYYLCGILERKEERLSLKTVVISGECMTEAAARRLQNVLDYADVYHVYGLTEASPRVSYLPPEWFGKYPLSVGIPLKSVQVRLVDGELQVRGKSIMKGYYHCDAAAVGVMKDGWLHTGDLAEIDAAGRITIKCRKDHMIIRAGMNIYPQEIENAIKQSGVVLEALAYGIREDTAGEKIGLKVVAVEGVSKQEIYTFCCKTLPSYQLPDRIDIVKEIPKNASGKVIRSVMGNG
ncbi:MAG: acyl--CoA ligase [Lachnospiraceae bacterium]|nr:acyl--CoA ligase [Lachnospiraceae bacterium]